MRMRSPWLFVCLTWKLFDSARANSYIGTSNSHDVPESRWLIRSIRKRAWPADIFLGRSSSVPEVTHILRRIEQGEAEAFHELIPLVYDELRGRAHACLRGGDGAHQTTSLVHEAFLKMVGGNARLRWQDRRHFLNAASEAMRQIVVGYVRRSAAKKRGGGRGTLLTDIDPPAPEIDHEDWEAVDKALQELQEMDERRYRVVMLRYFGGLTNAQIADTLGLSEKTVERDWAVARIFLRGRIAECGRT